MIFTSLFVLAEVSLTTSCEDNNIILRLSGDSDAHASRWNYAGYKNYICSSENLSGEVHSCTGNNLVLKLSDAIDGHASSSELENEYPVSVCYSDFNCVSRSSGCESDENCIVKLSSIKDSHIYSCNSQKVALSVCCKSATQTDEKSSEDEETADDDVSGGGSSGGGGGGGDDSESATDSGSSGDDTGSVFQLEDCVDNEDNDGDGNVDCEDYKCNLHSACKSDIQPEIPESESEDIAGYELGQTGDEESEQSQQKEEEKKSKLPLYIGIALIIVAAITLSLLYFFKLRKNNQQQT